MKVSLPKQLDEFVAEQVRSGRFENGEEVVRTALRQLEQSERQREMETFRTAFREVDQHSPDGEPTRKDLAEIDRIVKSVRAARRERTAA